VERRTTFGPFKRFGIPGKPDTNYCSPHGPIFPKQKGPIGNVVLRTAFSREAYKAEILRTGVLAPIWSGLKRHFPSWSGENNRVNGRGYSTKRCHIRARRNRPPYFNIKERGGFIRQTTWQFARLISYLANHNKLFSGEGPHS